MRRHSPSFLRPRPILLLLSILLCLLFLHSSLVTCQDTAYSSRVNDTDTVALTPPSTSVPDFIPTDEWQVIQQGQAIPPGLWVRMDMTTGAKTARLLPKEDDPNTTGVQHSAGLVIVPPTNSTTGDVYEEDDDQPESDPPTDDYSTPSDPTIIPPSDDHVGTLSAAALDLPPSTFSNPTPAQLSALKAIRAQRLRELSTAFAPTDDIVVIKQLLALIMRDGASLDDVVEALELLEVLVHQVDNAADFVGLGGLDVLLQMLESSPYDVAVGLGMVRKRENGTMEAGLSGREELRRLALLQEKAALVLGTAAQNNPHVQREAMKEQTLHLLLTLLDSTQLSLHSFTQLSDNPHLTNAQLTTQLGRVQAKVLYSVSSLLRSSPTAQDEFYTRRGLNRLKAVIASSAAAMGDRQQQTAYGKSVGLLSDLVSDRLINDVNASSVALFEQLTEPEWCGQFGQLTQHGRLLIHIATNKEATSSASTHALNTLDTVYTLLNLLAQHDLCQQQLTEPVVLDNIRGLLHSLTTASLASTSDAEDDQSHRFHFNRLQSKANSLLQQLTSSPPSSSPSSSSPSSSATPHGISLLDAPLSVCSLHPLTGYHRDGFCSHDPSDPGQHLICAVVSDAFLHFSAQRGNDLMTQRGGFEGLKEGDRWCLCSGRWQEALEGGVAPRVVLEATSVRAQDSVSKQALLGHAMLE